MLGNIVGIEENIVLINLNIDLTKIQNLIGLMVIMESGEKKIVGEIINIKTNIAYVNLLGEIKNDKFVHGVIAKPSFSSTIKLGNLSFIVLDIFFSLSFSFDKMKK